MGKIHKGAAWQAVRKQVLATADTCAICRQALEKNEDGTSFHKAPHPKSLSVDHIIPLAAGGAPYALENLQPVHLGCNKEKGTKNSRPVTGNTRDW